MVARGSPIPPTYTYASQPSSLVRTSVGRNHLLYKYFSPDSLLRFSDAAGFVGCNVSPLMPFLIVPVQTVGQADGRTIGSVIGPPLRLRNRPVSPTYHSVYVLCTGTSACHFTHTARHTNRETNNTTLLVLVSAHKQRDKQHLCTRVTYTLSSYQPTYVRPCHSIAPSTSS